MTEQPTEQWVQIFLRLVTAAPAGGGGPASALRTLPSGSVPSADKLPATRPERCRKVRRSKPLADWPSSAAPSVLWSTRGCVSLLINGDVSLTA